MTYAPVQSWKEVFWWLLRRRRRFVVRGDSMAPAFCDGDQVFIAHLGKSDTLAVGDVVVARHPFQKMLIIKRISAIQSDRVFLSGVNEKSQDNRSFGSVAQKQIVGKVTSHLSRSGMFVSIF